MERVHFAVAALNQTPLDWSGNLRRSVAAVEQAQSQGARLLLLPELCLTGYGCEDAFHSAHIAERAWGSLAELLPHSRGLVVTAGLPLLHGGQLHNVTAVMVDGRLAGFAAKQHLAGDGIHYEPRWFRPWPKAVVERHDARGLPTCDGSSDVPIGEVLFDVGGLRFGFEICEDAWVADRPGKRLSERGAQAILNPSASHFAFGKRAVRESLIEESSCDLGVVYLYANLLGNEAGRALYDGGSYIAAGGELRAMTPRFSYCDVQVASAGLAVPRSAASPGAIEFDWAGPTEESEGVRRPEWEQAPSTELAYEEFTRMVGLALFDYARKTRSTGYVVSLSGGADSATCAVLVSEMVRLGCDELGPAAFAERLGLDADRPFMAQLLTCAYQPTENSGPVTRDAAERTARSLGARYFVLDVQPMLEAYRAALEAALGRALDWERDDLTLQNLQARIRSPSIWGLANEARAILVATSNRSEAAVGYTTMDGDSSGGLAPISGVDKSFVLAWLRWMEVSGPSGAAPRPELSVITGQRPTAELRPPAAVQRDEDDLMPYDVLDGIEELYIRDRLAPQAVLEALAVRFPDHPREALIGWIRRFFGLWVRNQWKRERIAPSFHLDDESLDPKTWCRYPILGGDWGDELARLT
jgi:NAD+ synthase (glutamine-hydrolysing)